MREEITSRAQQAVDRDDIYSVAADWHNRLDEDASSAVRTELNAWLAADPRHHAAFDAVDRMWTTLGEARADPRVMELRRTALSASPRSFRLPRFAAVAAVLLLMSGAIWLAIPEIRRDDLPWNTAQQVEGASLRTAVGERSSVTLSDRSSIALNTNTQIDVRFTDTERRVRLLSGQAWFQVAKNPARPFIVEAGNQRVIALGTAFDVRIHEHRNTVQVTLAEGRVAVEAIDAGLGAILKPNAKVAELAPGESLIASRGAAPHKQKADVAKISSWRHGQVVFDNDTLEAAVAELNRYSSKKIELAGPEIGAYRVSGVFRSGHSDSFIETVTGHYPIRASTAPDGSVMLVGLSP